MDRVILHVDLNNFYASVECIGHDEFKDVPLAVCGSESERHGIVLAKNNIAKALGVKTGDVIWQAKTKARNLVVVKPHYEKYSYYSKAVREIYYRYTDRIETFGLDECWLDVTASQKLFGDGETIANLIREEVKNSTSLTVSVGVSFTKVFAKLGSDLKKPDAVTVLSRQNYKKIVWPLPVGEMLNIGKKTQKSLYNLNITTIGELANADLGMLTAHFGVIGERMKNDAGGIECGEVLKIDDHTPVKSVGNGTTTRQDMKTNEDVRTVLYFLAETVATRLRKYGFCALGISLCIKDCNLISFSRQKLINAPTNSAKEIARHAYDIFCASYNFMTRPPVRAVTIQTYNLVTEDSNFQTSLFDVQKNNDKEEHLGDKIDEIRLKFGLLSITKASFIQSDFITFQSDDDNDYIPFQKNNRS